MFLCPSILGGGEQAPHANVPPGDRESVCLAWLQGRSPLGTMDGFQMASLAPSRRLPSPFGGSCRVTFGNALLCRGKPGPESTGGEKLTACRGSQVLWHRRCRALQERNTYKKLCCGLSLWLYRFQSVISYKNFTMSLNLAKPIKVWELLNIFVCNKF